MHQVSATQQLPNVYAISRLGHRSTSRLNLRGSSQMSRNLSLHGSSPIVDPLLNFPGISTVFNRGAIRGTLHSLHPTIDQFRDVFIMLRVVS